MKKLSILLLIAVISFVCVYPENSSENTQDRKHNTLQETSRLFIDKNGDGIHDDIENMIMNKLQSRIMESIQQRIRSRLRFAFSRIGRSMPRHIRSRTDFNENIDGNIYNPFGN